jgi:hypothetical protein
MKPSVPRIVRRPSPHVARLSKGEDGF